MNFHSSTVSSNLLLVINEFGAKISARVVGGSSLWVKSYNAIMAYTNHRCKAYGMVLLCNLPQNVFDQTCINKIPAIKKCS